MRLANFEWNEEKNHENQQKHGVSFFEAQCAFLDCFQSDSVSPSTFCAKSRTIRATINGLSSG